MKRPFLPSRSGGSFRRNPEGLPSKSPASPLRWSRKRDSPSNNRDRREKKHSMDLQDRKDGVDRKTRCAACSVGFFGPDGNAGLRKIRRDRRDRRENCRPVSVFPIYSEKRLWRTRRTSCAVFLSRLPRHSTRRPLSTVRIWSRTIRPDFPPKETLTRVGASKLPDVMGATMTVRRTPLVSSGEMTTQGRVFRIS